MLPARQVTVRHAEAGSASATARQGAGVGRSSRGGASGAGRGPGGGGERGLGTVPPRDRGRLDLDAVRVPAGVQRVAELPAIAELRVGEHRPGWRPQARTRSSEAIASSGLVWYVAAGGIPTSARRPGSVTQSSGRKSAHVSGTEVVSVPRCTVTATWQLAVFPRAPQYWRATPTECVPCFGKLVASRRYTASGSRASTTVWARASWTGSQGQGLWFTNWRRAWTSAPGTRAAIGSTDFRSPSKRSPRMYMLAQCWRSAAAHARDQIGEEGAEALLGGVELFGIHAARVRRPRSPVKPYLTE